MLAVVFIAVFFSSIVGAQVFGISINKLALLPLELYLLYYSFGKTKYTLNNKNQIVLIIWYLIAFFSSISGMLFMVVVNPRAEEILGSNIQFMVSIIVIYIPIALMLWNAKKNVFFVNAFKKSFIITGKIHALWGIVQFILYNSIGYDLNYQFLGKIFPGNDWTSYSNLAGSSVGILLRVSGINHDPAFYGLLLIVAFVLDENILWRVIYFSCMILSFSRSALLSLAVVVLFWTVQKARRIWKFDIKKSLKIISVVLIICFVASTVVSNNQYVQNQLTRLVERFSTIQTGGDGTSRHMRYPLASLLIMIGEVPFLQKLLGVGVDCGGILITKYQHSIPWLELSKSMKDVTFVWAVESDLANVLLGTGFIGAFTYYLFYFWTFLKAKGDVVKLSLTLALISFSVMYNMAGITFVQLIYICFIANSCNLSNPLKIDKAP